MPAWLMLEADFQFSDNLGPIRSGYRADLQAHGSDLYYGVHFVSPPATIFQGDQLRLQMVVRAYPKDQCAPLSVDRRVFIKEGPLTKAEGVIRRRWEHQSQAESVTDLGKELGCDF